MAKTQTKYHERREVLAAIRSGALDKTTNTAEGNNLEKLLTARDYKSDQFFYWYKRFIADFEHGISKRGRARSGATKRYAYRRFIAFVTYAKEKKLDVLPPAVLSADDIMAFLARWNHAPRTRKNHHSDIRQLFNFLLKQAGSGVDANPMDQIAVPKYTVKRTKKITDANLLPRLVEMIKAPGRKGTQTEKERAQAFDMAILAIALSTGMRRGAMASVRTSRFDWAGSTLNYDDKGRFGIVSDSADCKKHLEAYLRVRKMHAKKKGESEAAYLARCAKYNAKWTDRQVDPQDPEGDDFFFRRPDDGFPATETTIANVFFRWSEWLGQTILPHMIRKHRGRTAWDQTKDLVMVKELMGHATVAMTLEYLEITVDERIAFMRETSPLTKLLAS